MSAPGLSHFLPSRAWRAGLLAASLLAASSPPGAAPPQQWMKLVEGARALPGAPAAAREKMETTPAWRAGLVRYDLARRVEIRPGRSNGDERGSGADLHERPAPMAWSDGGAKPEGAASSERLVRKTPAGEAVRPGPGPGPSLGGGVQQAAPHEGAGPTRAPAVEEESPPGAYRLLARFEVDGADFYFTGEATVLQPGELLAAGPCAYHHDPNGDGDPSDARWASEVWVWPAGTAEAAADSAAGPAGRLPATMLAVPEAWIARAAADYNAAIITTPPVTGRR